MLRNYIRIAGMIAFSLVIRISPAYAQQILFVSGGDRGLVDEYSTSGAFVQHFVAEGSGGLIDAGTASFGPDGNLYVVTSADGGAIKKYDGTTGAYLGNFATNLGSPNDFVIDNAGNVYVGEDLQNGSIRKYDANGNVQRTYTGFNQPGGLAFTPDGNLLVANTYARSPGQAPIVELDLSSGNISTFATGIGEPVGIIPGPDGRYYIPDYGFNGGNAAGAIFVTSGGGTDASVFSASVGQGRGEGTFADGYLFVPQSYSVVIDKIDANGQVVDTFSAPSNRYTGSITVRPSIASVPEPGSVALLLSGMMGAGFAFRRRKPAFSGE